MNTEGFSLQERLENALLNLQAVDELNPDVQEKAEEKQELLEDEVRGCLIDFKGTDGTDAVIAPLQRNSVSAPS